MILPLSRKKRVLTFERTYAASVDAVWDAWTQAGMLREWWGPENTSVTDCEVDLRVGGRIFIVMEAGPGMGKYAGTRWPLEGTFSRVEEHRSLMFDARSWTEGEEDTATIEHVNEVTFARAGDSTVVRLQITINKVGSGARMAAFGMKWGYKAQLDKLDAYLGGSSNAAD